MIEERFIQMRALAQKVLDNDLSDEEIFSINREIQSLKEEIMLLDRKSTELS